MNNIGQFTKKTTKQTASQVAKAVRDQSLEFARETNRQLSTSPNKIVPDRQHPLDVAQVDEKGQLSQSKEEIEKQKQTDDRYLKGLEVQVAQLAKQRENEILEQKKKEEEEKLSREQEEMETIEVAPPGDKSFKARSAGLMGKAKQKGKSVMMSKIREKQTAEIGKQPSN